MRTPASLLAYRLATRLATPFGRPFLSYRLNKAKEDPLRVDERLGIPSCSRPQGPLVWLHGASVGEALSLAPLLNRLAEKGLNLLATTGTVTSARLLAPRLPPGALHQFAPLDAPLYVRRFFDAWRPDLGLFVESELWPNMILGARRAGAPLALVNARLSERSFERWRRAPRFIEALLSRFETCLAQSEADAERFSALGAPNVSVCGNLKYDAPAPPFDREELAILAGATSGRRIWAAASTHPGEELIAAEAHRALQRDFPETLTLIAPRHVDRGEAIRAELVAQGFACALRSRGEPLAPSVEIYVCDTMGELGLLYRLAGVVFLGKSLAGEGGQNPIEPAKLASAILHGPHVANFADVYAALDTAGGAIAVADAAALEATLAALFRDPARQRALARAAQGLVEARSGAADRIMSALAPLLPASGAGR